MSVNEKITNKNFGDALKNLKDNKGWSYTQISIKTGLSAPYLNDLVNKKKLPPLDKNIEKISKAFGINPDYFFEYRLRRFIEYLNENRGLLKELYSKIKSKKNTKTA